MRKRIVTVFILCIAWNAQAQLVVSISDAQSQAEQMRINKERAVLETQYAAQETECYKRFAVNSCLGELRARKRLSMDALRRQEIVLNDVQRKPERWSWASRIKKKRHLLRSKRKQTEVDPITRTPYCSHRRSPKCPNRTPPSSPIRRNFVNR